MFRLHFESWWLIHLQPRKPFEFMNLLKFVFSILAPFQTYLYILYLYRYKHFFELAVVVTVVRTIFHLPPSLPYESYRIKQSSKEQDKTNKRGRNNKGKKLKEPSQSRRSTNFKNHDGTSSSE